MQTIKTDEMKAVRDLEREFEKHWIGKFKKHITLPARNWFVIDNACLSICYFYKNEVQYINLSVEEVPEFLVANRIISKVVYRGDTVKMISHTGDEVKWSDIEFSAEDIMHLASVAEYEKTGMKGNPAKIIWFYTMYNAA